MGWPNVRHISGSREGGSRMTNRGRPEGRAHRAKLRAEVLPYLRLGSPVPNCVVLGKLLGISKSQALIHMQRVLAEDGYRTIVSTIGGLHSAYISAVPAVPRRAFDRNTELRL